VKDLESAANEGDVLAFHTGYLAFHRLIWKLAGNKHLQAVLERLVFPLFAFVVSDQKQLDWIASVSQHREIAEGLLTGDPDQAESRFREVTDRFWSEHYPEGLVAGGLHSP
jgi:DNA-binding GntR family transcriptional regulator